MTIADFEPAKAQCSMVARGSGTGFIAYGSQSYVAGAALGNAIGNSIRAQETFNDCMSAKGWRIATPETMASIKSKRELIAAAGKAAADCVNAIRAHPTYASITVLFSDSQNKFTMAQKAMDRLATPSEAQLYARYRDEANVCFDKRQMEFEVASPEGAAIVQQARQAANDNALYLVKRQQTLSSFFVTAEKQNQDLAAKLKLINL